MSNLNSRRGAPLRVLGLLPAALVAAGAASVGCASPERAASSSQADDLPIGSTQQPVWVNGDFENDNIGVATPSGWIVNSYINPGVTGAADNVPKTLAALNLTAGGTKLARVVGGNPESVTDPLLGTLGTLRFPKYGVRAARVNDTGASKNVTELTQTMTATLGDVDPTDDKVHVRFAVAPVMNNPLHGFTQQPYYFVLLQNLSRNNATLYTDFNVSAQSGVPWKEMQGNTSILYTDWQLVDIAPGNAALAVGDQVKLTVIAANCAAGADDHFARIYVDAVGSGIPGLYSWANGPQAANAGDVITYTLNYKNGGTTTTNGTKVDFTTPPNTTFSSVSLGGACTAPAANTAGVVSCPVGSIAPGGTGSFQVSVRIASNLASGSQITNGNYAISATGVSALIGPKVLTNVTSNVQYADVAVTSTDGVAALGWGQPTRYTVVVTNRGSITAPNVAVSNTVPPELTNVSWTCVASNGSTCGAASGNGNIAHTGSLLAGGTFTYTIDATVVAGNGTGKVVNTTSVSLSGGVVDPDTSNNTAVDTNALGTLRTLSLAKAGAQEAGTINTTPAAIACGAGCSNAQAQFIEGSQVVLTAAPSLGASFAGWGGACAASGNATTCTLTINADTNVSASFVGAPASVSVSSGSDQSAAVGTAYSALAAVVRDSAGTPIPNVVVTFAAPGAGASASLSSTTATTNAQGIASVTPTANTTLGAYAINATIAGVATPATFNLTNVHGPAASVAATSGGTPQSSRVTTAFDNPLQVIVRDSRGNPVSGATVSFAAPAGNTSAALSAATATTNAQGLASVTATARSGAGTYTVQATVSGVVTPVSFTLTNTAGDPATVRVVTGNDQNATVTQAYAGSLTVIVEDANGNPVSGATVSFQSPDQNASAQLSAATVATGSNGQASVTAQANTIAGSYQVVARVTGAAAPASFGLRNDAGAPASITAGALSSPQSAATELAYGNPLTATVTDAFGNPVSNVVVSFEVPAQGSTAVLAADQATSNAQGQVSVNATAGTVRGSFTAYARVTGVVTPAAYNLSVLPAAPSQIVVVSGAAQSATVLTAMADPVVLRVLDAFGNAVNDATVALQLPANGASATLPAGPYTTDNDGYLSIVPTANTVAGSYNLNAALVNGNAPVAIALTNTAGAAAALTADLASSPQNTVVATGFALPLGVRVVDAHGNPVPGATVSFAAPAGNASASLSAATAVTDIDGHASVLATAGSAIGKYTVTASVDGVDVSAEFDLGNAADAPAHLQLVAGGQQQTRATTAFPEAIEVRLTDALDNPVADTDLEVVLPAEGPSAILAAAARTDVDGKASFTLTANAIPGALQLAVSAADGKAPLTIDMTILAIDTTLTLSLSSATAKVDDTVTATIAGTTDLMAPEGEVTLIEGVTVHGTGTLNGGTLSLPLTFTEPGIHQLTAVYEAQGAFGASRSEVVVLTIEPKPTDDDHDDDDAGTSSSGGSSGASSSGDNGASSGNNGNGSSNGGNADGDDNGWFGLGGTGCNLSATDPAGFSSFLAGLAMVLIARRRQQRPR